MTPEAEDFLASGTPLALGDVQEMGTRGNALAGEPVLPEPDAKPAPAKKEEVPASPYPIPYYNPKVIDERFYVMNSPYAQRFVLGRFVARNATEEASVRACLSAYGRDKPDRWKGDDSNGTLDPRRVEFVCRHTGFRTFNDNVKYDYETYHEF
jgi:hypothetical protein